jgi:hypothetical protein
VVEVVTTIEADVSHCTELDDPSRAGYFGKSNLRGQGCWLGFRAVRVEDLG